MKLYVKKVNKIKGVLNVSGSKNASLPIICGCLLTDKKTKLLNVPNITDVYNLLNIIKECGASIKIVGNKVIVKAKTFVPIFLINEVSSLRASYYLIGVSLYRYGKCIIKYPGGCSFCDRPIDLHIKAFKKLGYKVIEEDDYLEIIKEKEIDNAVIKFQRKSLGATINTVFASLNKTEVIIQNPSLEPEVLDLIYFLQKMGFNVTVSQDQIIIKKHLELKSIKHKIIPDRIEAGSYLLLFSVIPEVDVLINNFPIEHSQAILNVCKDLGVDCKIKGEYIELKKVNPNIKKRYNMNVYPSFPTDLQQILTACLIDKQQYCEIKDYIYNDRISHLEEIKKLGGNVLFENGIIKVYPSELKGGIVKSKDLRSAFSMLCLGAQIEEGLIIENAEILLRGYEYPLLKLKDLGFNIKTFD